MSRIGKQPIKLPAGVSVTIDGALITVKGKLGELKLNMHKAATATQVGEELIVSVKNSKDIDDRSIWGLTRTLVQNMVTGVTEGFNKRLELNGVGYKVAVTGNVVNLSLGYSHPINYPLPTGITALAEKNSLTISGIDKHMVGEVAAQIRRMRKPEPYKGKGIKYATEVIRRKAGKAAKAGK